MSKVSLLAQYLKENPVWVELIEVLEEQWGDKFRDIVRQLSLSRDLFQYDITDASVLRSFNDYKVPDRQTLQRVCTMLGFTYPNVDEKMFSTEDYLRIAQNIAAYYQEQGTESFLSFFSYCLNYLFTLKTQWTQNYVNFFSEGDTDIGTPVWDGGTWYPTSHVAFEVEVGSMPPARFEEFFKYIAPINLVLLATRYVDTNNLNTYHAVACVTTVILSNEEP